MKIQNMLLAFCLLFMSPVVAQEMHYRTSELTSEDSVEKILEDGWNKPDDFKAQYNAAIIHYNAGVELISNATITADGNLEDADKLTEEVGLHFRKALPHAEAAYRLDKNDANIVYMLQGIWFGLGNIGQSQVYAQKLEQLNQ